VMLTSSVQLTHALKIAAELNLQQDFIAGLNRAVVASIGPVASAALRQQGISVDFEPSHPKMGFLVKECGERSDEILKTKLPRTKPAKE